MKMDWLNYLANLTWGALFGVFLKICVLGLAMRFVLKFCVLQAISEVWEKYHGQGIG